MAFSTVCPLCAERCDSARFESHSLIIRCANCSTFIVDTEACLLLERASDAAGVGAILESLQESARAATRTGLCAGITGNLESGTVALTLNSRSIAATYRVLRPRQPAV